jgi:uncharacterized protein (TIGR03437 family)
LVKANVAVTPLTSVIKIVSPYRSLEQPITIQPTAPAIFLIGANPGGYIVVFATGLGATATQGQLHPAVASVTVLLNGSQFKPSFAGLTSGFLGLYQVNVPLPPSTPPGLTLPFQLQQGNTSSNIVSVSVQ